MSKFSFEGRCGSEMWSLSLFNGRAYNLLRSHCGSYVILCPLTFGNVLDEMDVWVISGALCLLLSLRVIPYPVQKNSVCSPISKGWTTRMPEQVKSGRTHQYLRNLWLLSFLSCCTERRGSLSPWAEQALTSYLGRPPHSRRIQLDTHTVGKLEGLEHVQVFIQNRQVDETWWMGKYTLLLFFNTSYSHIHEQINLQWGLLWVTRGLLKRAQYSFLTDSSPGVRHSLPEGSPTGGIRLESSGVSAGRGALLS